MKIQQLSLVLENRPGQLAAPIEALARAGINIMTLCLSENGELGSLRLIVSDWRRAKDVLQAAGVRRGRDRGPGARRGRPARRLGGRAAGVRAPQALHRVHVRLYRSATSTSSRIIDGPAEQRALLVFRFADPDAAVAALSIEKERINVVSSIQVSGAAPVPRREEP